jgi:hypothetical protein
MSLKKKLHPFSHQPFGGSVELIPLPPRFVEFIDSHHLWGFSIDQLKHFVLEENPEQQGKKTRPPHQLTLVYQDAAVTMRGWRLELMVGPLVVGRIARVHAEKHLGTLIIEEAWVSEIHVVPLVKADLPEGRTDRPFLGSSHESR